MMLFLPIFIIQELILVLAVPVTNVVLFIIYRSVNKKWQLKHLITPVCVCIFEFLLFYWTYVSPSPDGSVFAQVILAELVGVSAIVSQLFVISDVKMYKKIEENSPQ